MNYTLDFTPVIDGLPSLLLGCLGTFLLAICGMLLAVVIGIGGVALRDSRFKPVRWLVIGFVELIRNTPFLVQIFFLYLRPAPGRHPARSDPDGDYRSRHQWRGLCHRDHPRRRTVDREGPDGGGPGAWPA